MAQGLFASRYAILCTFEVASTAPLLMSEGILDIINDGVNNTIDLPVVKLVFWGSMIIVSVVLISLSSILVRLLK